MSITNGSAPPLNIPCALMAYLLQQAATECVIVVLNQMGNLFLIHLSNQHAKLETFWGHWRIWHRVIQVNRSSYRDIWMYKNLAHSIYDKVKWEKLKYLTNIHRNVNFVPIHWFKCLNFTAPQHCFRHPSLWCTALPAKTNSVVATSVETIWHNLYGYTV